jgi:uncharacterized protein
MRTLKDLFGVPKPLIAMCHLEGLPGRPRYDVAAGVEAIVASAAREVKALQEGGVDAILFCNENDIPYSTSVGVEAVATMTYVIGRLREELRVPYGTNLLWDPAGSLAAAVSTGASFIREVLTGVYDSDMGLLAPDLGKLAGYRQAIGGAHVALFANITPEFSRSMAGRTVAERAASAAYLGVDALLISGPAAGVDASMSDLREAKEAVEIPVLANTGVKHETIEDILAIADGAIVGTSLKVDGHTWNPVDPERVVDMMRRVRQVRGSLVAS